MATYKAPGVYLEEIAKLPPSIAEVSTAIPAFIGYTEITNKDANGIHPLRISSILEYETIFGKAETPSVLVEIFDTIANGALTNRTATAMPDRPYIYTMYYHLQLYFANGGGPCYIVSVGKFNNNNISKNDLLAGLATIAMYDEPTLLVFPEACNLEQTSIPEQAIANAAYQTAIQNGASQQVINAAIMQINTANEMAVATTAYSVYAAALKQCATLKNRFLIMDCPGNAPSILRHASYGIGSEYLQYGAAYYPFLETSIKYNIKYGGQIEIAQYENGVYVYGQLLPYLVNHDDLANTARNAAGKICVTLPPCSAIAAIYASTDRTRGVWKAPANTGLNRVTGTTVEINDEDQALLNTDPVAGKSINAIRNFSGKGTLVWGARTLAGNSNEWRYISVRRLFSMAETSIGNAIEAFVFENNDANIWTKVQVMIENYLTGLWRQGALQGAKPEQAFYVAIGLGKTMTPQDILEGRLIVEVGMAAVRPAEFIVMRFSHMTAVS